MGRCPRKDVPMTSGTKERRPRRRFSKEFKAEVVELVRSSGQSVAAVARRMDLTRTAVREWVRQADIDAGRRDGLMTTEREELGPSARRIAYSVKSVTSLNEPRLSSSGRGRPCWSNTAARATRQLAWPAWSPTCADFHREP